MVRVIAEFLKQAVLSGSERIVLDGLFAHVVNIIIAKSRDKEKILALARRGHKPEVPADVLKAESEIAR